MKAQTIKEQSLATLGKVALEMARAIAQARAARAALRRTKEWEEKQAAEARLREVQATFLKAAAPVLGVDPEDLGVPKKYLQKKKQ